MIVLNPVYSDEPESDVKPDCTLFVINIPRSYNFQDVSDLFSCFGPVESVVFQGMCCV